MSSSTAFGAPSQSYWGRGSGREEAHGREKRMKKKNHFQKQKVYSEDRNTEKNPERLEY